MFKDMKIENKIKIDENGKIYGFKVINRAKEKACILAVCCLDDKPFMLFDEWAAEQDPEFRAYFLYGNSSTAEKKKGKGIIVITHDDRFFHMADKVIKLERGKWWYEVFSVISSTEKNLVFTKKSIGVSPYIISVELYRFQV